MKKAHFDPSISDRSRSYKEPNVGHTLTTIPVSLDGQVPPSPPDESLVESTPSTDWTDSTTDSTHFTDTEAAQSCPSFVLHPPASTPEPFRDIDCLGPITLQRAFVITWLATTIAGRFLLHRLIWPDNLNPDIWIANPYIGIIWLLPLPSALMYIVGAIIFKHNTRLDDVSPIPHNVVFRIVSRGMNADCLLATIRKCRKEMQRNSLFPYLIEVVTDGDSFKAPYESDLVHLKVPFEYHTVGGTMFKARALHYACEFSVVPDDTWVVHLDEETRPTSSAIKGIAAFVKECEDKQDLLRVGQGCLLYHRSFTPHPFLTMADMRRTGDDLGHFYLQHTIGFTMFGLHGSFVVCRQDKEAAIGYDIGPRGSITEDAWWILLAMQRGYRTKWVDGYLEEQSTQSVRDFVKQRRRWYYGLTKVVGFCPVPWKYRFIIAWHVATWMLAPLVLPFLVAYAVLLFVYDIAVSNVIRVLCTITLTVMFLLYMNGLVVNMHENKMKWWKKPFYAISMFVAVPFCTALELFSVITAFFAPLSITGRGFHVVSKAEKPGMKDYKGHLKYKKNKPDKSSDESEQDSTAVR